MDDRDIIANLNPAQVEAVRHVDGPMLVVAGAGSGKTRVVTRRVARLLRLGVPAWRVLALTFTNKAAGEMRDRVTRLTGQTPAWMGTFHSVCARMLRFDLPALGDGRDGHFSIADTADQTSVIKAAVKGMTLDDKRHKPSALLARISRAKSEFKDPGEFDDDAFDAETVREVYARYEDRLRRMNAVDFDDLLLLAVRLLERVPAARDKWSGRFLHILVDEYQDTNHAQYRLLKALAGERRNLHATGDPDQSIYSWRGADYRNIMDFQRDYPGARLVRLEENYRSTAAILDAANALIRHNSHRIDKDLRAQIPGGVPVGSARLDGESAEALWIVGRIAKERGRPIPRPSEPDAGAASGGAESAPKAPDGPRPWRDFALFYRTNAQSRALEEALMGAGIPYQIVGGIRFYERREVKDLLAHLRVLVNPRDEASLERVLSARPTGVGVKTLEKLQRQAAGLGCSTFALLASDRLKSMPGLNAKTLAFGEFCRRLSRVDISRADLAVREAFRVSGLEEYWLARTDEAEHGEDRADNLHALGARAADFVLRAASMPPGAARAAAGALQGTEAAESVPAVPAIAEADSGVDALAAPRIDLAAFLEDVALVADVDQWDRGADRVSLMTLHSAKGLEFPVVFVTGLEEGVLPHRNADSDAKREEERRLLYVGLTRARELAFVTLTQARYLWGTTEFSPPSSFLREFPHYAADPAHPAPGAAACGGSDPFDPGGDYAFEDDPFPDDSFPDDFLPDDAFGIDPGDDAIPAARFRIGGKKRLRRPRRRPAVPS